MKRRMMLPLLLAMLLCVCAAAPAEGNSTVTMELNTAAIPVYQADDPLLAGLLAEAAPEDSGLPVMMLPVRNSYELRMKVNSGELRNNRYTLSSGNPDILRVSDHNLYTKAAGETVLTVTSAADPNVTVRYRVLVIQPVTRIELTASEKNVGIGETAALAAKVQPDSAAIKGVVWSSANPDIASVDENGAVTGLKRGTARIIATAADGSKIRANLNIQVVQKAETVTLNQEKLVVDVGRTGMLKATVLPANTNDKGVEWTSTDESVATVNKEGRVKGVKLGECEIICTSKSSGAVQARAAVQVQQPVEKIVFGEAPAVYAGETAKLTWTVLPENATNKDVTFVSENEKVMTVSADGTVTALRGGEAWIRVVSTDGNHRQARIKLKAGEHIQSVQMKRNTAYLDVKETATAGTIIKPDKATNKKMTWESADPSIAKVEPVAKEPWRAKITALREGVTTITGTTVDGNLQASIRVVVGDYSRAVKITDAYISGRGRIGISVKNVSSDIQLTSITCEVEAYDDDGNPVAINTKDGSNTILATYSKRLNPGKTTPDDAWNFKNLDPEAVFRRIIVRVKDYQIEGDWVKTLPKNRRPKFEYIPR